MPAPSRPKQSDAPGEEPCQEHREIIEQTALPMHKAAGKPEEALLEKRIAREVRVPNRDGNEPGQYSGKKDGASQSPTQAFQFPEPATERLVSREGEEREQETDRAFGDRRQSHGQKHKYVQPWTAEIRSLREPETRHRQGDEESERHVEDD